MEAILVFVSSYIAFAKAPWREYKDLSAQLKPGGKRS